MNWLLRNFATFGLERDDMAFKRLQNFHAFSPGLYVVCRVGESNWHLSFRSAFCLGEMALLLIYTCSMVLGETQKSQTDFYAKVKTQFHKMFFALS